jgi:hypothetical protein
MISRSRGSEHSSKLATTAAVMSSGAVRPGAASGRVVSIVGLVSSGGNSSLVL